MNGYANLFPMEDIIQHISRYCIPKIAEAKKCIEPLKDFGINVFWYYRLDSEGNMGILNSHHRITETWYNEGFYRNHSLLTHPKFLKPQKLLAEHISDDTYQYEKSFMRKACLMDHDYLVQKKPSENVTELFGFASTIPNTKLPLLAKKKPHVLDLFISHFQKEYKRLIQSVNENPVSLLPYLDRPFNEPSPCLQKLDEFDDLCNDFLSKNSPLRLLTKREKEAAIHYMQGLTAQETAEEMGIGRQCVETYFERIKNKLNLSSKRELFKFLPNLILN